MVIPFALDEEESSKDGLEIDFVEAITDEDAIAKNCLRNITECVEKGESKCFI